MAGAFTAPNLDAIIVSLNEPGTSTGATFTLSGGATVGTIEQPAPTVIVVHTGAALTPNTSYTLTATGVKDLAGNAIAAPANTVTFTSGALPTFPAPPQVKIVGKTTFERYDGANLTTIQDRIDNGPAPEIYSLLDLFEQAVNQADNFATRKSGWFVPPQTGSYVFFTASDDPSRLYLSTDANPANKKHIASEANWANNREWTISGGSSPLPDKRSDQYAATQWPSGNTIILVGGEPYYIEQRQAEGGGGDDGAATFKLASEADPANGTASRITGSVIFTYANPAVLPPSVTQNPVGKNFNKGDTVSLTVTASGNGLTYQWYHNKVAIPGATAATYTINNADETAIGDYSVKIDNANGSTDTFHADDTARLMMNGASFLVEAEDFNYQGGQHLAIADVMPYTGNAYLGLKSTEDIDFNNNNDESGGAAFAYTRFAPADANVIEMKGPADPADYNRGSFTVSANYAIGWSSVADWQNYTRTFPKGKFRVFAGAARDGLDNLDGGGSGVNTVNMTLSKVTNPTAADGSSAGVEGGAQGLTKLGTFTSPGTGAWSSNDVIPLTDDAGAITTVDLGGLQTLRVTFVGDQDFDYLLFYCTDCPTLNITSPANNATFAEGANVPLTVSATASSGTISKVEYFANGSKIGESTTAPFNFTVPNAPKGAYTVYAVATDSSGRVTTSAAISAIVGTPDKVLFLHAATASGGDNAVITHLKNRGFLVTDKGPPFATADATGFQLIVVSSSITSGDVGNKFLNTAVPEVSWEQAILDDQLMVSATDATKRGTATAQTQLNIVNAGHALAAGLSGTVTIASTATDINWGTPETGATVIAQVVGQPTQAAIFAFDTGDTLSDGTSKAPARRVHAFMSDNSYSVLNADGQKLVDAAITWALGTGGPAKPQITVAKGTGNTLTITWTNGGTLEYTDALTGATTVWTTTGDSDGSFTGNTDQAHRFYRVKQ